MNTSSLYGLILVILLLSVDTLFGQTIFSSNPSVSSMVRYEEYPVDLYTGAPIVSIPLYSMPTRSKDVNLSLALNYHPSAIAKQSKTMGDTGNGWNMSTGGAISRVVKGRPDEFTDGMAFPPEDDDLFIFNFNGHYGKFKLNRRISGGNINVIALITESNGTLYIDVTHQGGFVTAFNFYDEKGYKYVFDQADQIVMIYTDEEIHISYNASYQLTDIKDNNNNLLVKYTYQTIQKHEDYHYASENDFFKFISEINVPGYGKLTYDGYYHPYVTFFKYESVVISDYLNVPVKKIAFTYDSDVDVAKLSTVEISDFDQHDIQTYKLFYKPRNTETGTSANFDHWGYPSNLIYGCGATTSGGILADPINCTRGVLEKMILPTGGCVIYEYESNTYSYQYGMPMDAVYGSDGEVTSIDPGFYTDFSNVANKFNFTKNFIRSETISGVLPSVTYTIEQNGTKVYFQVGAESYSVPGFENPGGNNNSFSPNFSLKQGTTVLRTFSSTVNGNNDCYGTYGTYNAGTYTLQMNNGPGSSTGWVKIYTITQNNIINKWHYGGGIRIKRIGTFADENVPQDYYRPAVLSLDNPIPPSKETNFNYNLPTDPLMSSGSLNFDGFGGNDLVKYKYVTVFDSANNGKTVNEFTSAIDYPVDLASDDFRSGKLKNRKVYNSENILQTQEQYTYQITPSLVQTNEDNERLVIMGWTVPAEIFTMQYFPFSVLSTKNKFTYNTLRQVIEKESSTSRSAESLITKYFYHTGNSVYSFNRISDIERTEEYLNTDLLSVSKAVYSNSWSNPQNTATVNVSYLPQQLQMAKGSGTLETVTQVNLYDQYGNPLEIQKPDGTKKVYIYGYNSTQVIAEIDNIAYADLPAALITEAQLASDSGTEANLLIKLDALRNASVLADSYITTYTHKPLVGPLSVKDARGYKLTYEYDVNNNLKFVKDQQGNILSENQNHTKPQY